MTLLISFLLVIQVNIGGHWVNHEEFEQFESVETCHEGIAGLRAKVGEYEKIRFVSAVCTETWLNADGSRYVRPE